MVALRNGWCHGAVLISCRRRQDDLDFSPARNSMSKSLALLSVSLVCLLPGWTASIRAQQTPSHPDFTGVYFVFDPNAAP